MSSHRGPRTQYLLSQVMTASNQDANDDCDPGEPRVTYESLSLGEEQCLEVKKKIILILKLILVFTTSVNFVIPGSFALYLL